LGKDKKSSFFEKLIFSSLFIFRRIIRYFCRLFKRKVDGHFSPLGRGAKGAIIVKIADVGCFLTTELGSPALFVKIETDSGITGYSEAPSV